MRTLSKAIGIGVVALLAVSVIVIASARWIYGPLGPIPGPQLTGPVIEEPVADWSGIDAVDVIQLETNPEAPYSVNIWVTRVDDAIYVFGGGEESQWVQNIGNDPRVRMRVEGRIHELRAVPVEDLETKRAFLTNMKSKYEGDLGFDPELWQRGWETGELTLFRMQPR
jgi:hypothetical protein